jgi:hypothetical protein
MLAVNLKIVIAIVIATVIVIAVVWVHTWHGTVALRQLVARLPQ